MVFESSLAQTATQFADSLSVRPAHADKTADEQARHAKTPEQSGDQITISEEARALIAAEKSENGGDDSPFDLTSEEEERANKLFDELDAIFLSDKELTEAQEQRVEAIFAELDELFPVEEELQLTAEEGKQLDALFEQLDALYENETLTPEQEKQADEIEMKIEAIYLRAEERAESGEDVVLGIQESLREAGSSAAKPKTAQQETIDQLKEQIEELEEEIKALEKSDMPEKEKLVELQTKEAQLMELRDQLLKAEQAMLKSEGFADGGGTRANGFGNSVGSF